MAFHTDLKKGYTNLVNPINHELECLKRSNIKAEMHLSTNKIIADEKYSLKKAIEKDIPQSTENSMLSNLLSKRGYAIQRHVPS